MAPALNEVTVRGVRLALHPPGEYVSDRIRATRDFFEAEVLDDVARRVTGGTVVDAGAMIGNHAAFLALFSAADRILAFEPVRANYELLEWNVAPFPHVATRLMALSDAPGALWMAVEPGNMGHSRVVADEELPGLDTIIVVPTEPLDALGLTDVALLKVDVEGHEPEVLAGARETIDRCRPLVLIEDWEQEYSALLPGYRLAAEWGETHQTYLYEPA